MARFGAVLLTLAVVAGACGNEGSTADAGAPDPPGVSTPVPSSAPPAVTVESVTDAEVADLVTANNRFAVELYRVLADDDDGNLALGPWSISEGLALPFVGARGTTRTEMADVLHYDLPGDTQHAAFHTLRGQLRDRENRDLSLSTANRLFGQAGFAFLDEFLADVSGFYEAPLATVDFTGAPDTARAAINDWTAAQTNDRITDLFPPGSITSATRLALVNAIHFDADWYFPFNPDLTRLMKFTRPDGTEVNAELMHFNERLPIAVVGDHTAVQFPYAGREMSMVAVRPGTTLADLEADLDETFFAAVNRNLSDSGIHTALPKFELSYHTSLIGPLQELGLTAPFGAADFSGMTGSAGLFISAIEHEAFVKLDEAGTEAAAATGSAMVMSHGPTIDFDRAFVFYIQDDVTGTILFLGRVTDPSPA